MRYPLSILGIITFSMLLMSPDMSRASNIQIDTPPILKAKGTGVDIVFNISWEHSWYLRKPFNNWDAAWVFAKFKETPNAPWKTVYLSETGHSITFPNGITPRFTLGKSEVGGVQKNIGVFISRDAKGRGPIDWKEVNLYWEYSTQTSSNWLGLTIDVFALEMVYVPEGPFFVGSGSGTETAAFKKANVNEAFGVQSENALFLSNTSTANALGTNGNKWISSPAEEVTAERNLPATFPKGFKAFYAMKYELTQEAYKDFLNTLTPTQQMARTGLASIDASTVNKYVYPNNTRNGIVLFNTMGKYMFACDYRNDGAGALVLDNLDRPNDGQNIAMNHISLEDQLAYLDWAGLRPLTEFEYEKMCRGPQTPMQNEFAWGSTYQLSCGNPELTATQTGTGYEAPNQGNYNRQASSTSPFKNLPIRVGAFAGPETVRSDAGAGFYGIMELTGNMAERYINVSYASSHGFTGLSGDGELEANGNASTSALLWPSTNKNYIFRGGANHGTLGYTVSDRYHYSENLTPANRDLYIGCRGGRSAL